MAFLRDTGRIFGVNARTTIVFEVLFRASLAFLLLPTCFGLVDLAMGITGLTYLADTNISVFLSHPVTWILLMLAIVVVAACSLFEMCALIIVMHAGKVGHRIGVWTLVRLASAQTIRLIRPANWLILPFVVLLVPLTNIAITSSVITEFRPPEFIMDFIWHNQLLSGVFLLVFVLLCVHAFFLSFGLFFFVLLGEPWTQARRSSRILLHGNSWRLAKRLIGVALICAAAALVASLVLILLLWALSSLATSFVTALVASVVFLVLTIVISCVFLPFCYAALSATFYTFTEERAITVSYRFDTQPTFRPHRPLRIGGYAGIIALTVLSLSSYVRFHGVFEPSPAPPTVFEITAHRGASTSAPENTLAAFRHAIDEGADWVELDVQQTSDGVLVVMHDANLKRTTGLDKEFWEVTYDEIADLDNGSWFDPAFFDERICTLDEALALCKGKIKMNIEVKPDGHGTDLELKTIEAIKAFEMKDQVVIASISYDALVRAKQIDPTISTMYNMTLAYGIISDIEYVDYFSIDDFFVSPDIVDDVRRADKTIFAWTINDPTNVARLIEYGIDGLVTDNVVVVRDIADDYDR